VLWGDVTALKRAEAETHQLAYFDSVTGFPNRRGLIDLLQRNTHGGRLTSAALVVIGLDNFREINDVLGYELGDQVLRNVSERFSEAHSSIATVARAGAHDFSLLISGLSSDRATAESEAQEIVQEIRTVLWHALRENELGATSEFSAGIAIYSSLAEN
jgi:diguanylate cyclase (GGDEF)-like protein